MHPFTRIPNSGLTLAVVVLSIALSAAAQTSNPIPKPPRTAFDTPVTGLNPDRLAAGLALQAHFEDLARQAYQCTVSITAHSKRDEIDESDMAVERSNWIRDPANITDYPGHDQVGAGSGVVVSEDGDILTCRHFLLNGNEEVVDIVSVETPDQRHTICDVIAMEPTLDLALLRMRVFSKRNPPKFQVATFGDSSSARAGHFAFGVGDPVGPEQFFGVGVVTTPPNRDCYQELLSSTYIQIALRVHPETYGGPVFNVSGEMIGLLIPRVIKAGATLPQPVMGMEFAMPSNIIKGIYTSLRKVKSFRSPWLGFAVMSRTELRRELGPEKFNALAKPRFGIYLENVFKPSPATQNGVEPGDFLVHFDGEPVYSPLDFQKLLYVAGIDSEVELEFFRNGETFKRKFFVAERPPQATFR